MIRGLVQGNEARIRLTIRGPRARTEQIEPVIDTGFTSWLTLPRALIAGPRLPWQSSVRAFLADGSERLFDVYLATLIWDRRVLSINVYEADSDPLVGMSLLDGHELNMKVRANGNVTIKRLG
jgi:clan AA aspartic protease